MANIIGNPISYFANALSTTFQHVSNIPDTLSSQNDSMPKVREITTDDLKSALKEGYEDFKAFRTDVLFASLLYPVIGALMVWATLNGNVPQLVFPILSGFALIGPFAAVGLYEMSRRREQGEHANWLVLFDVIKSSRIMAIFILGLFHTLAFIGWLNASTFIYAQTMGPEFPVSTTAFLTEALTTPAGWAMIATGISVGFIFAAVVLATSVVSFPLLLDRKISVRSAVKISIALTLKNPRTIATWGMIVAAALILGSIPALLGLVFVMPIIGHATWHLFRKAVSEY